MNASQLQRHPFYCYEIKSRSNKKIQRKARPDYSSQFTEMNDEGMPKEISINSKALEILISFQPPLSCIHANKSII